MTSASVFSSAPLTNSAAVGPERLMRMSSGASSRKEKPRAGSSNWNDETPRSSTMPLVRRAAQIIGEMRELALHQGEAAGKVLHEVLAARDGVGIAVDAEHAAIGGFEDGARIAAATERAVDIVRAVLGRQHLQHLREHHGAMAAHGLTSLAASNFALRRATLSASTAA